MADVKSLVKALKDMAITQYGKGEPYRNALASALKGDMSGVNQALSQSELTPMDFAMSFAPMGVTAYHASPSKFDKFDPAKIGSNTDEGFLGHGAYFSTDPNVAANNPNLQTMKFDVNYENPLKLDFNNWSDNKKEIILNQLNLPKNSSSKDITNKLKELGHDSVELNYLPVGYNQKEIMLINAENAKKIK